MGRRHDSETHNKRVVFYERIKLCVLFFRLNIPPFVAARTVLEGLESEDFCGNEKPAKNEIADTKVKEPTDKGYFTFRNILNPHSNSAFLHLDLRQSRTEEGERRDGWPAQTVSHSAPGGGEPWCVNRVACYEAQLTDSFIFE